MFSKHIEKFTFLTLSSYLDFTLQKIRMLFLTMHSCLSGLILEYSLWFSLFRLVPNGSPVSHSALYTCFSTEFISSYVLFFSWPLWYLFISTHWISMWSLADTREHTNAWLLKNYQVQPGVFTAFEIPFSGNTHLCMPVWLWHAHTHAGIFDPRSFAIWLTSNKVDKPIIQFYYIC